MEGPEEWDSGTPQQTVGGGNLSQQLQQCCDSLLRIANSLNSRNSGPGVSSSPALQGGGLGVQTVGDSVNSTASNSVALANNLGSEQGPTGIGCTGQSSLFQVHRRLFRPGGPGPITGRRQRPLIRARPYYTQHQMWTKKLFCLSNKDSLCVPSSKQQKDALVACGLGEKSISIPLNSPSDVLHQKIMETFPKLSGCGGYELLRCLGNSKQLNVIEPPHTPMNLCTVLGQSRLYVRPVQSNIPLSVQSQTDEHNVGPKTRCFRCGNLYPMSSLRQHLRDCSVELSSDDDFEGLSRPTSSTALGHNQPASSGTGVSVIPHLSSTAAAVSSTVTPSNSLGESSRIATESIVIEDSSDNHSDSSFSELETPMPFPFEGGQNKMNMFREMFPKVTNVQMENLFNLVRGDVEKAITVCLKGFTIETLLRLLKCSKMKSTLTRITVCRENIIENAMAMYKSPGYDFRRPLQVKIQGSPAVDLGGPRRWFFDTLLREFTSGLRMRLFEGSFEDGMLPCINHDAIINGLFVKFGQILVQSVVNEGPGFPFFPMPLYVYITTQSIDSAIVHLDVSHLPAGVKYIVQQIQETTTDEELAVLQQESATAELMEHSGCTALLTVGTKDTVVQNIILYEVLLKRKLQMDQIVEGLSCLGLIDLLRAFPNEMMSMFVGGINVPTPEELLGLLRYSSEMSDSEKEAKYNLEEFISGVDTAGIQGLLRFCTGCGSLPPLGVSTIDVDFYHGDGVSVSTCAQHLKVPVVEDANLFTAMMHSILDSNTFNAT